MAESDGTTVNATTVESTSRPRIKAVLFDADGTLIDSLPPHMDFCHVRSSAKLVVSGDAASVLLEEKDVGTTDDLVARRQR
jgi:FMN phosphatase YigB (HAD superfamily)